MFEKLRRVYTYEELSNHVLPFACGCSPLPRSGPPPYCAICTQMKHARKDEAEDMAAYEKLRTESQASLTALEEKKVRPQCWGGQTQQKI